MPESTDRAPTRAGHVALVGIPNVGKSTLMNALLGEKLSITTAKEQTTRQRVTGILTRPAFQAVFVDTPGLLEPRYLLHEAMLGEALASLRDADVIVLILDATRPAQTLPPTESLDQVLARPERVIGVVNKSDVASPADVARLAEWVGERAGSDAVVVSATRGNGLPELERRIAEGLPASPFLYPEDEIAVQPMRFFVEELIRETVFERYHQEIPYSVAVQVEEYREGTDPLYIRATIYVERETQKQILIGAKGAGIRDLGTAARRKIQAFVGERVYLDLWTKVLPRWRKRETALNRLGHAPPGQR
ncbi:MAG: GTPase Era [Gemmatimonadota bacterium]